MYNKMTEFLNNVEHLAAMNNERNYEVIGDNEERMMYDIMQSVNEIKQILAEDETARQFHIKYKSTVDYWFREYKGGWLMFDFLKTLSANKNAVYVKYLNVDSLYDIPLARRVPVELFVKQRLIDEDVSLDDATAIADFRERQVND